MVMQRVPVDRIPPNPIRRRKTRIEVVACIVQMCCQKVASAYESGMSWLTEFKSIDRVYSPDDFGTGLPYEG